MVLADVLLNTDSQLQWTFNSRHKVTARMLFKPRRKKKHDPG